MNLRNLVKEDAFGKAYSVPASAVTATNYATYISEATAAWTGLFNAAWNDTRLATAYSQTGIWMAIYAGTVIVLGLLIFLLTRGKNNPFNVYTFWDGEKIAGWATVTPAILALVLGFIFKNFAQLFFLILFALRILWMTFRSLRPQPQQ